MIRKGKKINKMRGSRSNGGGSVKRRRGAGNKGGKGKAGAGKHHWSTTVIFQKTSKNYPQILSCQLKLLE